MSYRMFLSTWYLPSRRKMCSRRPMPPRWARLHFFKPQTIENITRILSYLIDFFKEIKSNLSLYSLYNAETCNEFTGSILSSLRPGNTATFEEMSQRWWTVGNTVFYLTSPRFEPQTSRFRDERVTAPPTGRY